MLNLSIVEVQALFKSVCNGEKCYKFEIRPYNDYYIVEAIVEYSAENIRFEELYFDFSETPKNSEYFGPQSRLIFCGSVSGRVVKTSGGIDSVSGRYTSVNNPDRVFYV